MIQFNIIRYFFEIFLHQQTNKEETYVCKPSYSLSLNKIHPKENQSWHEEITSETSLMFVHALAFM